MSGLSVHLCWRLPILTLRWRSPRERFYSHSFLFEIPSPSQWMFRCVSTGAMRAQLAKLLDLPFHKSIAELEKRLIARALRDAGGNKSEAANRLQINRRLLYNKIEEHKIEE